jgi:DNA-binding transcriptional ArsR family regulator
MIMREIVPRRVAILTLVRSRHELRAGDISKHFRSTRPGISQHLRVLTNAGLLCERNKEQAGSTACGARPSESCGRFWTPFGTRAYRD